MKCVNKISLLTEWNINASAFEGHKSSQSLDLIEADIIAVTNTTFALE